MGDFVMFRSTNRLVWPVRQRNAFLWRSPVSQPLRSPVRASVTSFTKNAGARSFQGVSRGNLAAPIPPARTSLLIPQTRKFFVRNEVPETLRDNVYQGWNRVYAAILAVNAAIWVGWQSDFLENLLPEEYGPLVRKIENILETHFTVSDESLDDGRWWTLVTSAFSHQYLIHGAVNMLAFYSFGSYIFHLTGFGAFSCLVLGAAAASSLAFVYSTPGPTGQGMSGVVAAVATTAAAITPLEEIIFMGISMPIRRIVFIALAFDFFGFISGMNALSTISHASHLGGYAFGFTFSQLLLALR